MSALTRFGRKFANFFVKAAGELDDLGMMDVVLHVIILLLVINGGIILMTHADEIVGKILTYALEIVFDKFLA